MSLDIHKVEEILRLHWQIPAGLSLIKLREEAGRIQVLVSQKYSHENLKYQLKLIQTKSLKQDYDEQACNQIAADLLKAAKA
jgi:hypothetical protein